MFDHISIGFMVIFHSHLDCQCIVFALAECKKLSEQLADSRKELNETKSQVVVAEYKRETDIQHQDRKAQEEIASLQHLVHGKRYHRGAEIIRASHEQLLPFFFYRNY